MGKLVFWECLACGRSAELGSGVLMDGSPVSKGKLRVCGGCESFTYRIVCCGSATGPISFRDDYLLCPCGKPMRAAVMIDAD